MEENHYKGVVAAVMRKARLHAGNATQDHFGELLAEELGMPNPIKRQQLSGWENGADEPRAAVLIAAARVAFNATRGRRNSPNGPTTLDSLVAEADDSYQAGLFEALVDRVERRLDQRRSSGLDR